VEEAKAVSEFGGDSSDWANTLAAQKNYRSTAEEALGFNKEGFEVPEEYSDVSNAISTLQDMLPGASEEEKVQIQAEISKDHRCYFSKNTSSPEPLPQPPLIFF